MERPDTHVNRQKVDYDPQRLHGGWNRVRSVRMHFNPPGEGDILITILYFFLLILDIHLVHLEPVEV